MKIFYTLILLLIGYTSSAQERSLVSSVSLTHQSDYLYSISIGEPIIGTLSGTTSFFSQGFIPMKSLATVSSVRKENIEVSIFPNPAHSTVKVKNIELSKNYYYLIFGLQGNLLRKELLLKNTINISTLAPGSYILKIYNDEEYFKQILIKN